MLKFVIPSCDELASEFGCDCSIDENYVQKLRFLDEEDNELTVYIGHVEGSARIVLNNMSDVITDIYLENLENFHLDERKQIMKMIFNSPYQIIIEITLWSKFKIKITGMSN